MIENFSSEMESSSKLTNECFNDVDWDLLNPKNPGMP